MRENNINSEAEKLGIEKEARPQGIEDSVMVESEDSLRSKDVSPTASCELNAPPGFENYQTRNNQKEVRSRPSKKIHQGVVTRSKKDTQHVSSSSTTGTLESLVRLANESLDVGQLLRVRIIGNRQSVVRRLTRSLKNQRTKV